MRTLSAFALAFLLLGCGPSGDATKGDVEADPAPAVTAESPGPSESDVPSESASEDPFAPNTGDRSLELGETRKGSIATTTVLEVRHPYPPGEYRSPQKGQEFVGIRAKQCIREGVEGVLYSVDKSEWALLTANGDSYSGGSGWNDWPTPRFPEDRIMRAGECVQGWTTIEVPEGLAFTTLQFVPVGQGVIAEWNLN